MRRTVGAETSKTSEAIFRWPKSSGRDLHHNRALGSSAQPNLPGDVRLVSVLLGGDGPSADLLRGYPA